MYDPRNGEEPVHLESFQIEETVHELERKNCFSIYWIESGQGEFQADMATYSYQAHELLFSVPYQYLRFQPAGHSRGTCLQFHANFLCVETFHAETGCSGVLFNDPYGVPGVPVGEMFRGQITHLLDQLDREQKQQETAWKEAMLASTQLLLILATRLKNTFQLAGEDGQLDFRHALLGELQKVIESNYCQLHAPAEYADLLHTTTKTLGRLVKEQLGKTLSQLIQDRILIHAKWQLLHTLKPVKEIACELGFADQLYFSRLFRKKVGLSPTRFREFETEIRGGSNLSID